MSEEICEWEFTKKMLEKMGFALHRILWRIERITYVQYKVLLNG